MYVGILYAMLWGLLTTTGNMMVEVIMKHNKAVDGSQSDGRAHSVFLQCLILSTMNSMTSFPLWMLDVTLTNHSKNLFSGYSYKMALVVILNVRRLSLPLPIVCV
jgi:hypothetical protein